MHILYSVLYKFPNCWQGEFVQQSRASLVGEHFLYSCDLNVQFREDIIRKNQMLATIKGLTIRWTKCSLFFQVHWTSVVLKTGHNVCIYMSSHLKLYSVLLKFQKDKAQ